MKVTLRDHKPCFIGFFRSGGCGVIEWFRVLRAFIETLNDSLIDSLIEWFFLQLFGCQKLPHLATQSQVSLSAFLKRVFGKPFMVLINACNFFLFWLPKLQLRFHWRTSFFGVFLKIMLTKFSEVEMFLRALSRQLSFSNVYYRAFLKIGHF